MSVACCQVGERGMAERLSFLRSLVSCTPDARGDPDNGVSSATTAAVRVRWKRNLIEWMDGDD